MPPSSCRRVDPASRRSIAAFSQRMPPVQKLTTVLPARSSRWRGGVRELGEPLDAPVERARESAVVDLEGVARVEQDDLATLVVVALIEPARSVRGATAGARPAPGRIVGWSMRMISRLTLTSMLANGCSSDQLSFVGAPRIAGRRGARR